MKRKNLIVISLIVILLLVTLGISVAVFSSLRTGNTDNTITLGDLKFHYTEITGVGNGINLVDPLPISDSEGKVLNGEREYFDFSIESNTIKSDIEYEVVVEPTSKSTVSLDGIKFYLTEVVNNNEQEIEYSINENNKVKTLSEYNETEIENASGRTVYSETIANNTRNYYKKFRARIWLSEDIDWTDEGYIGKTGSFKINVYAKGKVTPKQLTLKETVLYESNGGDSLVELADSSFTRVSNEQENGLFKSTKTNTGRPTYYYRGNVDNNWVSFAGELWRIVRINEDGTVRLIMQDGINNNTAYQFNTTGNSVDDMYYSNSDTAKPTLESWYVTNITNEGYNYYVAKGNYYCEQAKTAYSDNYISLSGANMISWNNENYNLDFKCSSDMNGHGLINSNIGTITYEEVVHAGLSPLERNVNSYLQVGNNIFWTMSPAGRENTNSTSRIWTSHSGSLGNNNPSKTNYRLRPVINIKANVKVIDGTGTQNDPYIIGTTKVYESIDRVLASLSNDTGDVIICDGLKGKLSNCNKYNDLATAIASRNKGTIILADDTVVSQRITLETGKEYVLELNGKTIKIVNVDESSSTYDSNHNIFKVNGKLIVNDKVGGGGIYVNGEGRPFSVATNGYLVINGGDYNGRHAIYNNNNGVVEINNGTFTSLVYGVVVNNDIGTVNINGGTFSRNGYVEIINQGSGTININGGTFISDNKVVRNQAAGTVNINGGNFISSASTTIENASGGKINITQTNTPIYIRTDATSTSNYVVANMGSGTIKIKGNTANNCTDNPANTTSGLCVYADRDTNNNTRNAFGVVNAVSGKITVDGGTYYTNHNTFNHNTATTTAATMTIKNVVARSNQNRVVSNGGAGTININSGNFEAVGNIVVANSGSASTGTINIKGGTFISQNTTPIRNMSVGTLNIIQEKNPIYMATRSASGSNGVIGNNNNGTLNITASKANACTATATDTTSGLCAYSNLNDDTNVNITVYGGGTININGGTYYSAERAVNIGTASTGIYNIKNAELISTGGVSAVRNNSSTSSSVINVCNTTISGNALYDIATSYGDINYTSDVIFKNGTNIPNSNVYNTGSINKVNRCPF